MHILPLRRLAFLFTLLLLAATIKADASQILLAKNKAAQITIVLPKQSSASQQFAGAELAKYLQKISGAVFSVASGKNQFKNAIGIELDLKKQKEDYSIATRGTNIILTGGSDRAILYAVYDFLARLGCHWLAPGFAFYNGTAEYVPQQPVLYYDATSTVNEHPAFAYRKLDVEEGQTHTIENLKQLIDWMPKLRFNTLMIPINYQGEGRVKWDKWRIALTPELQKRGLMIEVGGHGYQNFMNAKMEDGTLFKQHPDWFGKDKDCKPNPAEYLVFNTTNQDAMHYFVDHVLTYLKQHPEINIFDFWPPDGAHWADCPEWQAWGTPEDRQARLLNLIDSAVNAYRPDIKLEIIAYAKTIFPPQTVKMNKRLLIDICPIDQNFETQIYDTIAPANVTYNKAIHSWREKFDGDIGLYSYFRKYAWKSLPNVIPHYIQHDMQWYAGIPMQGITTYAEPGDWYTYELNYFVLGQLAWNPHADVDSIIRLYCQTRYGAAANVAQKAYAALEHTVRIYGSIRNSTLKSKEAIGKAINDVDLQMNNIRKAKALANTRVAANFSRLLLMFQYAVMDLQIREAIADKQPKNVISEKVNELLVFLRKNIAEGTFLLSAHDSAESLMKYNYSTKSYE